MDFECLQARSYGQVSSHSWTTYRLPELSTLLSRWGTDRRSAPYLEQDGLHAARTAWPPHQPPQASESPRSCGRLSPCTKPHAKQLDHSLIVRIETGRNLLGERLRAKVAQALAGDIVGSKKAQRDDELRSATALRLMLLAQQIEASGLTAALG